MEAHVSCTSSLRKSGSMSLECDFLYYRPQRSWGKVIFSEACVHILSTGGHAWLLGGHAWLLGGHAWLLLGGAYMVAWGACMVAPGGHAWLFGGACMVAPKGGVHGCSGGVCGCSGGRAWDTTRYGDMVNERAVRIPLECILVDH